MTMKQLPLDPKPLVSAYPAYAYVTAILGQHEQSLPWLFSNFIQLSCNSEKGLHRDWFDYHVLSSLEQSTPWFFRTFSRLNRDLIAMLGKSPTELVRGALELGYYVIPHVDEKVLPFSCAYGREDIEMPHSILIYGFDDERELFFTTGFYKYGEFARYQTAEMTFAQFDEAYRRAEKWVEKGIPGHPQFDPQEYDYMSIMHIAKFNPHGTFEFRIDFLIEELQDYLYGRNSSHKYTVVQPLRRGTYGLNVYGTMQAFLARVLELKPEERGEYMDPRPFYILWEHKNVMNKRLAFLQRSGYLLADSPAVSAYMQIESDATAIQNNWIKFMLKPGGTGDRIAEAISSQLDRLRDAEQVALEQLISELEPHREA